VATPIKPKVKGRKRIARKRPPKAKKPPGPAGLVEHLHLTSRGKPGHPTVTCFTLSEDIIERLMDLHDQRFHPLLYVPRQQRMRRIRLQFIRMIDAGIPAVMLMIEPPTYDPRGKIARRNQKRFEVSISTRKLGLVAGHPRRDPEWFWADNMLGLVVMLPDEDFSGDPPPRRQPGDPLDLVAR
jgi:hypothetical protein